MNWLSAALLLGLVGGGGVAPTPAPSTARINSEMLVSTSWLLEHVADRNLVILCVGRSRSSYDTAHIPGARFLPFDELVEQHTDSLNDLPSPASLQAVFQSVGVGDASRVILYGDGGGLLAARAYFTLDYLGHGDQAALLDGGIEKWVAEGKPTDHRPVHPQHSAFTPHVRNDVLITTPQLHKVVADAGSNSAPAYVLLDARPPREFDGSVMSEAVPKAGHLRGAKSLYWKTLLQSESPPSLLDASRLEQALVSTGADPSKMIVTYCRTGMQSSFTYFVAKYLGYRVAMYDGSVYEWVNRAGYDLVVSAPNSTGSPEKH